MGGCHSSTIKSGTSVSQGSVLGPFLIAIFMTFVCNLLDSFSVKYHEYDDDTRLYITINPWSRDRLASLSAGANAGISWYLENYLFLYLNMTEAVVTATRLQIIKFDHLLGIEVAGSSVPFVDKLHVLCVTLDSQLTFDDHVSGVVHGYFITSALSSPRWPASLYVQS